MTYTPSDLSGVSDMAAPAIDSVVRRQVRL